MSRFLKLFAIALLALFFVVPPASAQRGHGWAGGWYGAGWGRGWYGPGWGWGWYGSGWGAGWYGPGWGWGWYGPGWGWGGYAPYYWGGYAYGYGSLPHYGNLKIVGVGKETMVYVDGGYAGRVGELKKFRLSTGNHNIELRDPTGHAFHSERIQVLPGRSLEIQGSGRGN